MAILSRRSMLKAGGISALGTLGTFSLPALAEAIQANSTPFQQPKMKIADVRMAQVNVHGPQTHVRVYTDSGLIGQGESTDAAVGSASLIRSFRRGLIGQDPLNVEGLWERIRTGVVFAGAQGGQFTTALTGLEIALWDLIPTSVVLLLAMAACAQQPVHRDLLWYNRPAPIWDEALPVGNGRLGAMVFGGANQGSNNGDVQDQRKNASLMDGSQTHPQDEHLQLNESTVWQGSRGDVLNPRAHEGFLAARKLLLESKGKDSAKIAAAEKILNDTMLSTPRGMPGYSTLGDLYLRSANTASVSDYRRSLDLDIGVAHVSYQQNGVLYEREVFASAPDQVVVVHLTANRRGAISLIASMDRPEDFVATVTGTHDITLTPSADHKEQIRFHGQVRVLNQGGTVERSGNGLQISGADSVTLLIAAATDFKGGSFTGADPAQQDRATLERAQTKTYEQLRSAAIRDVSGYMQRMKLSLGTQDATLEGLPTDERLRMVSAGGNDLGLQTLYFQFARYLLVGSSRPGGLPANLQGLWAGGLSNPWGSKYTINVNLEMNYWLAEPASLGDLHQPLFEIIDMVSNPASGTGRQVAQTYYGAQGFVIHHNTDIWGDAHPIDGVPYGIWPMGGAWLTLHAWDHYAFSLDREFLRAKAWPLLHDASLFYLDYLTDDGSGHLVTGPSLSPENKYKMADATSHSITMGPGSCLPGRYRPGIFCMRILHS